MELLFVGPDDFQEGVRYFLASSDPKLSLVDSFSLAVCMKKGLRRAFAYDEHFAQAGLQMVGVRSEDS